MTIDPAQLVVLDMAGTTVDDRHEVYRVLRDAVEREGATIDDATFQQWMGTEKRAAIAHLLAVGGVQADDARVDAAFAWFLDSLARSYAAQPPTPLPGIEDMLATLRAAGIRTALTTGFSRGIAEMILEAMGWGVGEGPDAAVDALVCADEVDEGRPAPLMILEAMERTGVSAPSRVVSVGDTAVDVESARRAGVLAVGVLTGRLSREDLAAAGADSVLDSAAELTSLPALAGLGDRA